MHIVTCIIEATCSHINHIRTFYRKVGRLQLGVYSMGAYSWEATAWESSAGRSSLGDYSREVVVPMTMKGRELLVLLTIFFCILGTSAGIQPINTKTY